MMVTSQIPAATSPADEHGTQAESVRSKIREIEVALLTGGRDAPYAYGMTMALSAEEIQLEVIGGDSIDFPEFHTSPRIHFLNLRGDQSRDAGLTDRIIRVLRYYVRLIRYAAVAKPTIFHILWNNKIELFDRTLLLLYYRLLGKKIVFTAHNVNAGWRDANDSVFNRISLRAQYRMADHIFVHTEKMKHELLSEFPVGERKVSVIPFGINNSLKVTALTRAAARAQLGIAEGEKAMLFFGHIAPYKGLDCLVDAFLRAAAAHPDYRLIIVGAPRPGCDAYWKEIERRIRENANGGRILQRICFIPDDETELYFKAADVAVLPYRVIFQSGVLFLAYSFGLPVIACDVGSLAEDILPGETGFLCQPDDPAELAATIEKYFQTLMYKDLENRRQGIREFALARHSWEVVGERTRKVYLELLGDTSR
jgi:D-inositol-3-phosphate glycosyltransferase